MAQPMSELTAVQPRPTLRSFRASPAQSSRATTHPPYPHRRKSAEDRPRKTGNREYNLIEGARDDCAKERTNGGAYVPGVLGRDAGVRLRHYAPPFRPQSPRSS
jgi:hypothetical protein